MKNFMKNITIMFVLAICMISCEADFNNVENSETELGDIANNDVELCQCLNMEDVNKTIPIINEFLAGLPNGMSKEQTFEALETWLNSFSCNVDAKILYGTDMIWGQEQMYGVSISVKDNEIVRELKLDFDIIDNATTYSRIVGYVYYKQDAIHVKTKYTNIDDVFDFINSLELDVKQIEYGTYLSSMDANADILQSIIDDLKVKPYTTDSWVTGHLNWYNANFVIFLKLYDMKNTGYQTDWKETMNKYKLVNYTDGAEHIVVFYIPEGTGVQWETYFSTYDFVQWAELSYTRYTIR